MSFSQKKKKRFAVLRKTPQEILKTQDKEDKKSVKPNSILVNETQTQGIPETQELDDTTVIPETHNDVIVIDD